MRGPGRPLVAIVALALVAATGAGCASNPRGSFGVSSAPPQPSGGAGWSHLAWQQAGPLTEFGQGARIEALAERDGLVLAGGTTDRLAPDGLILLTEDGRAWQRATGDDLRGVEITDVVATAEGFVAVGSRPALDSAAHGPTGLVLTSPDGRDWQLLASIPGVALAGIAAGPSGYLAVGEVETRSVVFVSTDGRRWESLAPASAFGGASVVDAAAVDGGWVAIGTGDGRARAWTSSDGRAWTSAPMDGADPVPGIAAVQVRSITPAGTGLMALGTDDPPCEGDPEWCPHYGAAWWSSDGKRWLRLPTEGPLGQWGQRVFGAGDAGFVVFDGSAALLSKDGWTWTEVPTNGPAPRYLFVDRAVLAGDLLVVAGMWIGKEPATLGVGLARIRR